MLMLMGKDFTEMKSILLKRMVLLIRSYVENGWDLYSFFFFGCRTKPKKKKGMQGFQIALNVSTSREIMGDVFAPQCLTLLEE